MIVKAKLKHGGCAGGISDEYRIWRNMISRCNKPRTKRFCDYGGRGISVCGRWLQFENFLADMGNRPSPKHSLDRINNDGNYEPSNCRWATPKEQTRNMRRNVWVYLEDGSKVILKDYAAMNGVDYHCMYARYVRGQPLIKTNP